jgi:hypothetical protein
MKVSVQRAIIDMSMVLKPSVQLWSWEVPVVQEKFGGGKVRLLDEVEIEIGSLPDADDEFVRLGIRHGSDGGDGGTNMSFVELAYGRGAAGKKALEEAIRLSEVGAKRKRKPRKKAAAKKVETVEPEITVPTVEANEGDPLAA